MLSLMKEDCELCVEVMVHSAKHASVEVFQTLIDHIEGSGWDTEACDFQGTATCHKRVGARVGGEEGGEEIHDEK